ncbi:MAG: hypothetical protein N3B21_09870 [Clostridia bacterium]|nr:hypothetical protein [Clostridia bacterium]
MKLNKIKLTEKDKKVITANTNICTDTHGKGCNTDSSKENNKNLH